MFYSNILLVTSSDENSLSEVAYEIKIDINQFLSNLFWHIQYRFCVFLEDL